MFLHIGSDFMIYIPNILGIFDADAIHPNSCHMINVSMNESRKSVVIVNDNHHLVHYYSSISVETLQKRMMEYL